MQPTEPLKTLVKNLEELTSHVNDSIRVFKKAAEKAHGASEPLERRFLAMQEARQAHADVLNEQLESIGEEGNTNGSIQGAAHRGLVSVKDLFTKSDSSEAIAEEALRGEKKLLQYIDELFEELGAADDATRTAIIELRANVACNVADLRQKNV